MSKGKIKIVWSDQAKADLKHIYKRTFEKQNHLSILKM